MCTASSGLLEADDEAWFKKIGFWKRRKRPADIGSTCHSFWSSVVAEVFEVFRGFQGRAAFIHVENAGRSRP